MIKQSYRGWNYLSKTNYDICHKCKENINMATGAHIWCRKILLLPVLKEEYQNENRTQKMLEETTASKSLERISDLNIKMLSEPLFRQIFGNNFNSSVTEDNIKKSILQLKNHGLWGKKTSFAKDVDIKLPFFKGKDLDEHFRILGESQCSEYKKLLSSLLNITVPTIPETWSFSPGWTQYNEIGEAFQVSYPECSALVFDTEVCISAGQHPTLACAVSDRYWYSWCSQELVNSTLHRTNITTEDLIPFNKHFCFQPKVIVGHNVSFDRKAVREEYLIEDSKIRYVDTMSMHIAVSGLVEEQRNILLKNKNAEKKIILPWMSVGSTNSLKELVKFYLKEDLEKEARDIFVKGSLDEVRAQFQHLMTYCSQDVKVTQKVLNKLLPLFFERFPHPVTFAGMLEMNTAYLPVSDNWFKYTLSAEEEYRQLNDMLNKELIEQALNVLTLREKELYKHDPWLWDLDWALPKGRVRTLQNYPNWYRNLCKKRETTDEFPKPENMSTSLRIVPKLLRLTWKGFPLHYAKEEGWGFLKPIRNADEVNHESLTNKDESNLSDKNVFPLNDFLDLCKKNETVASGLCSEDSVSCGIDIGISGVRFYHLPHKNGEGNHVGNPLAKDFLRKLEDGTLSSAVPHVAALVLKITKTISYWKNNRDRILSQTVMWLNPKDLPDVVTNADEYNPSIKYGAIIPQVITAGTITRRAVEKTWMTASNAYSDRIGSELKSMIIAPPGYHFVGADVDSQELWIAAVLGDAYYTGLHGSTALGWMTLQGKKSDGTDMHSRTAETTKISRNNAKVINYGRIYGAGLKFIQRLLKQFNDELSDEEIKERATKLLAETKGEKGWYLNEAGAALANELGFPYCGPLTRREINRLLKMVAISHYDACREDIINPNPVWVGGSESHMFNCLESIARSERPRTPVLGARITRALEPWCVGDQFMTSRVNWVVQSSAVDFLHLMLVCMRWLFTEYKINGRFSISIHDEVRYLVASEDRYRAGLALHITNLLTRSYISMRLGINDLPQSVAFFEGVDIDKVIRKEPDMDCMTPSNPKGLEEGYNILKGETMDIHQIIEKTNGRLEP